MTVRTLTEAAAEVLNRSRTSAVSEPMHKMNTSVVDLGGATHEKPEGTDVGAKASAVRSVATPPGKSVSQSTGEKMKKLPTQPQQTMGNPTTSPEKEYDHAYTAGHEYMKPTIKEDEESSEEEAEELLDSSEENSEESEGIFEEELTEEELAAALEEARANKRALVVNKMRNMKMEEDMNALFTGEELSEEFKEKATTIFEAAVIARAVSVVEEMEEEILNAAEESIEEIKQELEEQIDAYLNYVAEEWVAKNELAVESGLRSEITEEFMSDLRDLFIEHNIDIPEDKVDVVQAMAEEIEELKSKLNEEINVNVNLSKVVSEAKKSELVNSVCEGLTATQAEKVKTLAEGVEFTTEGDFVRKVGIIRESYIAPSTSVKQDNMNPIALTESEMPVQTSEISPLMERYVNALSRTTPR